MNKIKFLLTTNFKSKSIQLFFNNVFTKSESKKEGKIVGDLSFKLAQIIDQKDIIAIESKIDDKIIAFIFLTKLNYNQNYSVYLLAPVAVDPNFQNKGLGKKIIKYAIKHLKTKKIDLLMTYGDPRYYSKIGFKKTTVSIVPAPFKLSQPIGWLMNKISSKKLPKLAKKPECVLPFRNKKLW